MISAGGRRFVAFATIAALAVVPACASKGARPSAATLPPIEQLRHDLSAIFGDPAIDHAQWSVAVDSIARGDSLFRQNAQRLQVPASNQKTVTTAVAVERLGWDFRYTTRLYATGPIADGVLNGDLVVTSDGDPTINPRHPERMTAFDNWAQTLADRGVRRIAGLVGDDNAFAEPGWGLGWSWDDIPLGYGTQVGALQFNESEVDVSVSPAREVGARALINLSPLGSGLTVERGVTTGPAGSTTRVVIDRVPGSNVLTVRGEIALDAVPVVESAAPANPTQQYVEGLRDALARHGIFVAGGVADIDDLAHAPSMSGATLLLEDRSPPLSEIIDVTLKFSRNLYAETMLRTLGAVRSPEPALSESRDGIARRVEGSTGPGPGTPEAGLQVVRETLLSWGIPNEGYLARDGSGLSRYDWITANALNALLLHVAKDPKHADLFRRALAVPGEPGTLETRMLSTPAQTRVWAKTGSMSQVRSISGYVTTVGGEPLVFAILVNGFRMPSREVDAVMDKALARLVDFKRN